MLAGLEYRIRMAIRSGLTQLISALVAIFFIVAGLLCLLVALWVSLAEAHGTVFAALVTGGALLGLGLVVLAIGLLLRPRPLPPAAPVFPVADLIAAFMQGMQASRAPAPKSQDAPDDEVGTPEPEKRES